MQLLTVGLQSSELGTRWISNNGPFHNRKFIFKVNTYCYQPMSKKSFQISIFEQRKTINPKGSDLSTSKHICIMTAITR